MEITKNLEMKKMSFIKVTIFIFCLLIILLYGNHIIHMINLRRHQSTFESLVISHIELSRVPSGTFRGTSDNLWIYAVVDVTVQNGIITRIQLEKHSNVLGKAAEEIPRHVLREQSLDVDVISGATYSSKAILQAIERALKNAIH